MVASLAELEVSIIGNISNIRSAFSELESRINGFGKSLSTMGSRMQGMGASMSLAVTAPLTAMGGLALNTAVQFDDAMRKVQAVTGETGEGLQKLTDYAMQLGAETAFSSSQAADAMLQLGQAGFTTEQIMASTSDVLSLASAGAIDLGTAAGITANAINGFGLSAEDSARVVDVLAQAASSTQTDVVGMGEALSYVAPIANSLGISIEQTAAMIGVMSNAGIEGSRAGTALRGAMSQLVTPSNTAAEALAKYGITVDQVNPSTNNFIDILRLLGAAGMDAGDILTIFGTEAGPGMAALLNAGIDSVDTLTVSLENSDGAAQQMAETMEGGAGGAIRQLQGSIETLQITIGNLMAEALLPFIDRATELFNQLSALPEPMLRNIIMISGLAAAIGPTLIALGTLIKSTGTIISLFAGLPALFGPVGVALLAIGAAAAYVYTNWDSVGPWLMQQFESVRGSVENLVGRLQNLVTNGLGYIANWWSMNGQAVMTAIMTAFQRVVDFIEPLYTAVRNLVTNAFSLISNWWIMNGSSVMETLRNAFDRVMASVVPLITTIRDLVERALNAISAWWSANGQTVMNGLNTAFTWLIDTGSRLIAVALDLANRALVAISNWWSGSGQGAINALWQDLLKVADAVRPLIPLIIQFVQDSLARFSAWWATNGPAIIQAANNIANAIQWLFNTILVPALNLAIALLPYFLQIVQYVWSGIAERTMQLVNTINFFADAWHALSGDVSTVLNFILATVTGVFNSIRNTTTTSWNSIRDIISGVLNTISGVISTVWNVILSVITSIMGRISTSISGGWSGILTTARTTWESIRSAISGKLDEILSAVKTIIDKIKAAFDTGLSGLPGIARTAMGLVASAIRGTGDSLKSAAADAGQKALDGLSSKLNAMQTMYNTIKGIISQTQALQASSSSSSSSSKSGGSSGPGWTGSAPTSKGAPYDQPTQTVKREKHATGGIAGYTGWHWMERGELAIPQQTNWDQLLVKPIVKALSGGSSGPVSAGNVIIQNMPVTLTSGYNFEQLMSDIEKYNSQKRFQRGISL